MARPELGLKRQCLQCGAKFYDLARNPATCPKCDAVFQVTTSRVAPPIVARATKQEVEEDEDDKAPDTISLEEAEESEDDSDINVDDDSGDDEPASTGANDDTFLEEEDGDDDVSDLIDNDGDGDDDN